MSKIEVEVYQLVGHNYMHRIVWRNKITGVSRSIVNNDDYLNQRQWSEERLVGKVDYADFCNYGDLETRKQEMAAFLANIAKETTGQGATETTKRWGLYYREEQEWHCGWTNRLGYVNQFVNPRYPPTRGKSYHGRGPMQITHNVNYGQLSEFLYGDKQILLDDPDKIVPRSGDATVAFMTAIWFWMTPQAPKPSCHAVMTDKWVPTQDDIKNGRTRSKFGATINVINGGLECNGQNRVAVEDRVAYYRRFCGLLGITPEENPHCHNMSPW